MQAQKTCRRPGCIKKKYFESQNKDGECLHHKGKPIFHDTKKGWTCCNKLVYDWDEFEKLPTCAVSFHSDQKDQGPEFFESDKVKNAESALKKEQNRPEPIPIKVKDINQYNKQQQIKKSEQQKEAAKQQKKPFLTKQGKRKCINKGCLKSYDETENNEDACDYHKGQAVFHDVKKYWNCCGKQTMDWDEFMKLPTCCKGWHSPKLI